MGFSCPVVGWFIDVPARHGDAAPPFRSRSVHIWTDSQALGPIFQTLGSIQKEVDRSKSTDL